MKIYISIDTTSYFKGKFLHRTDGPAFIEKDEDPEWWIDGENLEKKQFNNWVSRINYLMYMKYNDIKKFY